jgi:hypothetical protein
MVIGTRQTRPLRYLDSFNNVNQFGAGVNTDTKALEVGASWRF